jgi:3-methylcrotonyl-CoA carboxylase alpha subunit
LKATCGGGGKGLRVVHAKDELAGCVDSVRNEAKSSFGDERFLLEKYFSSVQHIEVQIVGDSLGSVVALGTRNCSVQRRHQKLIEEAPSPGLPADVVREMCAVAVHIGTLAKYSGAGTVEFIFDPASHSFYFLEVNTRLQVEHRVTERTHGNLDLVRAQLLIAMGYSLSEALMRWLPSTTALRTSGERHSIECRLCAEVPTQDFMPSTGRVLLFQRAPATQAGVSYDASIETGSEIGVHFDSMICKVVVAAEDRATAVERMLVALEQTVVMGVRTNKAFLMQVLRHEAFGSGCFDTHFIATHFPQQQRAEHFKRVMQAPAVQTELALLALLSSVDSQPLCLHRWSNSSRVFSVKQFECSLPWLDEGGVIVLQYSTALLPDGHGVALTGRITLPSSSSSSPSSSSSSSSFSSSSSSKFSCAFQTLRGGGIRMVLDGKRATRAVVRREGKAGTDSWVYSSLLSRSVLVRERDRFGAGGSPGADAAIKSRLLVAPMPSRVLSVHKQTGDQVKKGELLVTVESMKMEVKMHAAADGVVEVLVSCGQVVKANSTLVRIVDPDAQAKL